MYVIFNVIILSDEIVQMFPDSHLSVGLEQVSLSSTISYCLLLALLYKEPFVIYNDDGNDDTKKYVSMVHSSASKFS
jgi:hypothetical protein